MVKRFGMMVLVAALMLPATLRGQVNQALVKERDNLKVSRDSILHLMKRKDSMLVIYRRDSVAMAHLIQSLEYHRDSLSTLVNEMIYRSTEDSIRAMQAYTANREFNRLTRNQLVERLPGIDEDSVKTNLRDVFGIVFDDTAFSPKPRMLRSSFERLVGHLDNDSVYFRIINTKQDTIPFTLKQGKVDSTAFFLMNSKNDSARVYMRSLDKHTLYMWVGEDLMLQQLLKKQGTPEGIPIKWLGPMKYRIPRRPVPQPPVKLWNKGAEFNFTLAQAAFVHWARGGTSNVALTTEIKARANYAKGNVRWDNGFWFVYGVQKAELLDLRKSQDKIEITSALSHKAFKNFDYTVSARFLTQGFKGYSYPNDSVPVSRFLAPGTFTLIPGLTYRPPKTNLTLSMSPFTGKFTMILDTITIDQTKYGLKEGKKVRSELGANIVLNHRVMLFKNVTMANELVLFTNYLYMPEKIDIDWRLALDLKVNKYINTFIRTNLIYDYDILVPLYEIQDGKKVRVGEGRKVQFMENFSIGFKYIL